MSPEQQQQLIIATIFATVFWVGANLSGRPMSFIGAMALFAIGLLFSIPIMVLLDCLTERDLKR